MADHSDINRKIDDALSYPILTEEVSFPTPPSPGTPSVPGLGQVGQIAEGALRQVLGWRPKANDPKGFVAALTQAFSLKEVEGHTEWKWTPRSYAVQPDMGAVTGAQASIYTRAKAALDQSLPLLDGLYPLRPDFDPQDTEAIRTIVRSELIEFVNELGVVGGPRVQRVDGLLRLLIGYDSQKGLHHRTGSNKIPGQLGDLQDRFGLKAQRVNTVEEEQNLTNFLILVDYVDTLTRSWHADRHFFNRVGSDVFLGTQLVLLSQQLEVVVEQVREAYFSMDSVFLGPAERQTTELHFKGQDARLTVAELLEWVERFASEEGPRLLQDAGKDGVAAFRSTIDDLRGLMHEAFTISKQHSGNPTRGFHTPRVQRSLEELSQELARAFKLAHQVIRFPQPVLKAVNPDCALQGQQGVWLAVYGANFQEGAEVRLTHKDKDPIEGSIPTVVGTTQINATFNLPKGCDATECWTVEVINPDKGRDQLENSFTIKGNTSLKSA